MNLDGKERQISRNDHSSLKMMHRKFASHSQKTNQRLTAMYILVLACIWAVWYFMESAEETSMVDKEGLVSPKKLYQRPLDLYRQVEGKEETLPTNHAITCPPWNHDDLLVADSVEVKDDKLVPRNFSDTISPDHTIVRVLNEKPVYNLCDKVIVQIVARDWNGQFKTYGGDFFRMKIFSEKPYSAASEDKLIDFNNGTYLAYFTLRWSGNVKVQIKLVHPVEIFPDMEMNIRGIFGANHTFIGKFMSSAGGAKEERLCRYIHSFPGPFCNVSNKQSHGPWFCEKPEHPNLTCDDWKFHQMYTKKTFVDFNGHLSPLAVESLQKSYLVNIKNNCTITVQDRVTSDAVAESASFGLAYCSMKGLPTTVETNGHFFQGRWYPNDCKVHDFSEKDLISCIAHKRINLFGDSTLRQIYYYFRDTFPKTFTELPLQDKVCQRHGPLTVWNETLNSSVYYHFHGLPVFGSGLVLRTDFIKYVADALDSMGTGLNDVVVISVWSHFLAAGKEFYVKRWIGIKSSIQRFLDRNPEAKVIIKSGNTRTPSSFGNVISSIWNVCRYEGFVRKLFKDEKRVGFIDALDITKVQPYRDNVHPRNEILREFLNRILTYTCKD